MYFLSLHIIMSALSANYIVHIKILIMLQQARENNYHQHNLQTVQLFQSYSPLY